MSSTKATFSPVSISALMSAATVTTMRCVASAGMGTPLSWTEYFWFRQQRLSSEGLQNLFTVASKVPLFWPTLSAK